MRRITAVLLLVCTFVGCDQGIYGPPPTMEVYFSPKGGCTDAVVGELDNAKKNIRVQAYSFTSAAIARALVDAHKRGVDVCVILDESQRTEKYSEADFLHNMGIPTWLDCKHAIAHNKVMTIDDSVVITGSFNFTTAAEKSNAENLLLIRSPELAQRYMVNWHFHLIHSMPYRGRDVEPEKEQEKKPAKKRKAG